MPQKKRTPATEPIAEQKLANEQAAVADKPAEQPEQPRGEYNVDEIQETEKDVDISEFAKRMDLNIICRGDNEVLHFSTFNISRPGLQLAGYYKHFAPERVQIMGEMEMTYLQQMTHDARKTACETLMKQPIPCLIVTSVLPPCDELIAAGEKYNRVLLTSKLRTTPFVNKLSLYLSELLAPSVTIHGVLMDLYGVGVLLIGESGIGKSETALSLIERGHRLVADDAVTISRIGDRLDGTCPDVIRYFMEVRGIGIIDIKAMYGASAVQLVKKIDMVVKLEAWDDKTRYTRLGAPDESYTILGVKKPLHIVPVKPGRNLAVILEAAARTHRLNDLGFSAMDELNERLRGNNKK